MLAEKISICHTNYMGLLGFILLGYCIYLHVRLSRVDNALKQLLGQKQATLPKGTVPQAESANPATDTFSAWESASASSEAQSSTATKRLKPSSTEPDVATRFFVWLATDWLLKLGAFLVLLGIGWFVRYAFAQNWVGPIGRVSLGLMVGVIILAFGELWGKKRPHQGTVFLVLGATTILLTIYAARTVYDFFTPLTATGVMLSAVVFMAASSVIHKTKSRAGLSILLAAFVPFLTHSTSHSTVGFMAYLFIVVAGMLWVVAMTGWIELSFLSIGLYSIYSILAMWGAYSSEYPMLRILVAAFAILFYFVNLISHVRLQKLTKTEYFTAIINALFAVLWIHTIVPKDWRSLLTSIVALCFFLGAAILFKKLKERIIILEYAGVALALLAAAASFQFSGTTLLFVFSILIVSGIVEVWLITRNLKAAQWVGVLFVPILFRILDMVSTASYSQNYGTYYIQNASGTVMQQHTNILSILGLVAVEVATLGYWFFRQSRISKQPSKVFNSIYLISALYFVLYWIWLALEYTLSKPDTAHGISLLVMTLVGLACYIQGRILQHKIVMYTGGSVLITVAVRLLLVEVWTMALVGRVIVFLLIGILLMSTAFLRPMKETNET